MVDLSTKMRIVRMRRLRRMKRGERVGDFRGKMMEGMEYVELGRGSAKNVKSVGWGFVDRFC